MHFVILLPDVTAIVEFLCHSNNVSAHSDRQPNRPCRLAGIIQHATRVVGVRTKLTWLPPGALVSFVQNDGSSVQIIPLIFWNHAVS
jgi:hypothetical protein